MPSLSQCLTQSSRWNWAKWTWRVDIKLLDLNLVHLCSELQACKCLWIASTQCKFCCRLLTCISCKHYVHLSHQRMLRHPWPCEPFCCLPGHPLLPQLYSYVDLLSVIHLACWELDLLLSNVNDEGCVVGGEKVEWSQGLVFMNGWQMPGLLWSGGIPTVWSNQEWIVHASWSVSHYNQRNRIRLVLPLTARCLWSDRSSSRSCIIVCATNIISFRILKLWECVPGIWKASICCEPFSKIVGTTLATAVAFQVEFEWFAQGVCGSVFLGWQGIVVCCMGW